MKIRIAAVQHGDYLDALKILHDGQPEPYAGMYNTLDELRTLFHGHEHMVISLNAEQSHRVQQERGVFVGLPPLRPRRGVPTTLLVALRNRKILKELAGFNPTHVLLRSGGLVAWSVLRYCIRNRIGTLALFANTMGSPAPIVGRRINRELVAMLNDPTVLFVGNHRLPATWELREAGVQAEKLFAYDWPSLREPADYVPKRLIPGEPIKIVFAGNIRVGKGILELVDAVGGLARGGLNIRLRAFGTGPALEEVRRRCETFGGIIDTPGVVENDAVFDAMLDATFVCVPSRHDFTEGLPFTITEALASRTPLLASDHPVFIRAFADGEGVRFFPAQRASDIATLIHSLAHDEAAYADLSKTTAQAYERVRCHVTFGDLIGRWRSSFVPHDVPALSD